MRVIKFIRFGWLLIDTGWLFATRLGRVSLKQLKRTLGRPVK
jgi:hypothetical protein